MGQWKSPLFSFKVFDFHGGWGHQVVIRWTHPESYNIPVVHYKAPDDAAAQRPNPPGYNHALLGE